MPLGFLLDGIYRTPIFKTLLKSTKLSLGRKHQRHANCIPILILLLLVNVFLCAYTNATTEHIKHRQKTCYSNIPSRPMFVIYKSIPSGFQSMTCTRSIEGTVSRYKRIFSNGSRMRIPNV